jgi:hypothetical protein
MERVDWRSFERRRGGAEFLGRPDLLVAREAARDVVDADRDAVD